MNRQALLFILAGILFAAFCVAQVRAIKAQAERRAEYAQCLHDWQDLATAQCEQLKE